MGARLALGVLALTFPVPQDELVLADGGASSATIVLSARAGEAEKRAAADLARAIELLSGAKVPVAPAAGPGPAILVGTAALEAEPALRESLAKVAKKNPVLRAEAIVLRRKGNRVFLAGTDDGSHAYAVAELLRRWGCRWYLPTEFGECIPVKPRLAVGDLDAAYAPPFEVRRYWISWNGDPAGAEDFKRRNFFNEEHVPNGHCLERYVKGLVPKGGSPFNVPISEEKTVEHVAAQVADAFGRGERIMMGMEDGVYDSDSARDKRLMAGLRDKYFLSASLTDAFFEFYNGLSRKLLEKHPQSAAKIGFLAYANLTIPPQRNVVAEKPLVAYLAPIDIDPIHSMDDPRSPPRGEYKQMLYRWARVMQGRLVVYDYDQSMLVWRDLPNPTHLAFRHDVRHYRKAGILGVDTESRNAIATTFLNLYFRGLLLWNPDADVDAELEAFYPAFYGPAAEPMRRYWTALYDAWEKTIVTEHEHFVIPAVYPRALVEELRGCLTRAEDAMAPLAGKAAPTRNEKLYRERLAFTRLSFEVLDHYTAMVKAAATDADYAAAAAAGEKALAAREKLTEMNGTFTTYRKIGEHGPAWFPGEVAQYRNLAKRTDGTEGTLIAKLPLEWAFRRDPNDTGLPSGWASEEPDLAWWNSQKEPESVASRRANPGRWERVRSDLYLQAQGVLTADHHGFTGYGWYHSEADLGASPGKVRLLFPGLFNQAWLYVNGFLVEHRPLREPWWHNDYAFQWDVDLTPHVRPGANAIVLRIHNPHHFGGMYRRPFLYRPAGP
jgi:hypothetical protein